ncbi:MAG: hypothetical protein LT103_02100 [Burkholderiaceae bacterium]|nr:hypothetical protein [Burkholderiaceae bacterium]ODS96918.1 MAG: hypothetical protein ABS56_11450 [Lautropia sp. SCN 69-89]
MMVMSAHDVFQKTGKGADELRTRRHGLGPRLRQLLILVDGRRDIAELSRMLPGPELGEQLAQLEQGGFVARPFDAGSPQAGGIAPAASGPAAAPAAGAEELRALRTRVTRALLDTIGPNGDDLAIRIERAHTIDELRALLPAVLSVVEACRGRAGVDDFLQRCGAV